jgi:long-subunit fatty acid transport protein
MKDTFGFGLGVNACFGGKGVVEMSNVSLNREGSNPDTQTKMDLEANAFLVAGFYVDFGKIFKEVEGLDFGVSYRQENYMEIQPFDAAANIAVGNIPINMNLSIFDYYQPHTLSLGLAYAIEGFTVTFALDYQMWSLYKVSVQDTTVHDELVARFGSEYKLPELKSIFIPRIGFSYTINSDIEARCGYYYQPSFVPDEATTGRINFLENKKHAISAGGSYTISRSGDMGGPVVISLAYQFQMNMTRSVTKTTPGPDNPEYTYGGMCHTAMLEAGMKL